MSNQRSTKEGFTLVEVMIAAGVLGIMTMSIFILLPGWQRSWNINQVQMDVQFQARRAMSTMARELTQTSPGQVAINVAGNVITFRLPNNNYAAGAFTWNDQIQYSLVAGQLLRTNLNTAAVEVLASYINGLGFVLNNDIVSIQLSVNRNFKGENALLQLNSQVSLRNL